MHGMAHPEQSPHDVASHIRRGSSHARDQLGGIELCGCQRHLVLQGNYLGVLCDGHVHVGHVQARVYTCAACRPNTSLYRYYSSTRAIIIVINSSRDVYCDINRITVRPGALAPIHRVCTQHSLVSIQYYVLRSYYVLLKRTAADMAAKSRPVILFGLRPFPCGLCPDDDEREDVRRAGARAIES